MASTNKVLITYLLSMVLAALPIVLLVDDAHWLNILAFTYLMGGLAARGTSLVALVASSRWAMGCFSPLALT